MQTEHNTAEQSPKQSKCWKTRAKIGIISLYGLSVCYPLISRFIILAPQFENFLGRELSLKVVVGAYWLGYLFPLAAFFFSFATLLTMNSWWKKVIYGILLLILTLIGFIWNMCNVGVIYLIMTK